MKPRDAVSAGVAVIATLAALTFVSLLMGSHMPFRSDVAPGAEQLRANGQWQAIAVLAKNCPCSKTVAEHLVRRGLMPGVAERIIAVDAGLPSSEWAEPVWPNQLIERGFDVRNRTPEQARAEYGVPGAPILIVLDPSGNVRYSGGFAGRSDFRDGFHEVAIVSELRGGQTVAALPARGCALGSQWFSNGLNRSKPFRILSGSFRN